MSPNISGERQCSSPPIFQCTTNKLVLYIVYTIVYYIYNPSKINTATCHDQKNCVVK